MSPSRGTAVYRCVERAWPSTRQTRCSLAWIRIWEQVTEAQADLRRALSNFSVPPAQLEKDLPCDIKGVMTTGQVEAKWPMVERALRRKELRKSGPSGMTALARIDLAEVMSRPVLRDATTDRVRAILDDWEAQVDTALIERQRIRTEDLARSDEESHRLQNETISRQYKVNVRIAPATRSAMKGLLATLPEIEGFMLRGRVQAGTSPARRLSPNRRLS